VKTKFCHFKQSLSTQMHDGIIKEYSMKMKNKLIKTCLTGLALSVAGLANAEVTAGPVTIFTPQLMSHAAISAAAISISADSLVDGHIASQAAVTTGAGSEVQNIVSGAATGIGAAAKSCDIYAGAAIAVGAGSTVGALTAGGAITLGALANRYVICDTAVVTSDFDAANAQIKSAQSALDTLPANDGMLYAYTFLAGNLEPGVYEGAAITIPASTVITFDANGEDGVWIFNLSGALTVGALSEFKIINPGDNNAVIWNIGGALTLGAGSTFLGTAFVEGAVSGATASVSCGNLYATGAISIGSIGSVGGDDCKVSADQLADFVIKDGSYSFGSLEAVPANTPPVAFDGPEGFVPTQPNDQPYESGPGLKFLLAEDANGDSLTFIVVPGSLGALGNNFSDFQLNPETGEWSVGCIGLNGGHDSFQWVANDGQADSNVATQYFVCAT
jgi:hypothetical protein